MKKIDTHTDEDCTTEHTQFKITLHFFALRMLNGTIHFNTRIIFLLEIRPYSY